MWAGSGRACGRPWCLTTNPLTQRSHKCGLRSLPDAAAAGVVQVLGHDLPAGTDVLIPIYHLQRSASLWPDPEVSALATHALYVAAVAGIELDAELVEASATALGCPCRGPQHLPAPM